MSTGLAASTVTPGSTAPEASLIWPAIAACARTRLGKTSTHDRTTTAVLRARILPLLIPPGIDSWPTLFLFSFFRPFSSDPFSCAHDRQLTDQCQRGIAIRRGLYRVQLPRIQNVGPARRPYLGRKTLYRHDKARPPARRPCTHRPTAGVECRRHTNRQGRVSWPSTPLRRTIR